MAHPGFDKGKWRHNRLGLDGGTFSRQRLRGKGANDFYGFHIKKKTFILAHFFMEKGHRSEWSLYEQRKNIFAAYV